MQKNINILLLFFGFLSSAQAPSIAWQKAYGGNQIDGGTKIIICNDGGYLITGESRSSISGDKTVPSKGGSDIWIIKTSSTGVIEWQKAIGGSDYDVPSSLQQTSDGGYLIAGNSQSNISGDKTENSLGFYDYWILKLDSQGTIVWQNTIGASSGEVIDSSIQTADGGYLLGGSSVSFISGDKTENNIGFPFGQPYTTFFDYWIVKIDAFGNVEWDNTIGTKETDILYRMINDYDGGFILAGYSQCDFSGDYSGQPIGEYDLWILKIDENGTILWQKTIGGSLVEYFRDIISTSDGGYLLGAMSKSNISGNKTENSKGGNDYWIIKIDALGNVLWDKTIGGNNEDILFSIKEDNSGNFYLGGSSKSTLSGDKTQDSRGGQDAWIVKTDNNGNVLWDKTIGGSSDDYATKLIVISEDTLILSADSKSSISGEKTEASRGDYDFWVVQLVPSLTTSNFTATNIQAVPNPTRHKIQISLPQVYENIDITIVNILGQIVQEESYQQTSKINCSIAGAAGIYLVNIANENGEKVSLNIVKE